MIFNWFTREKKKDTFEPYKRKKVTITIKDSHIYVNNICYAFIKRADDFIYFIEVSTSETVRVESCLYGHRDLGSLLRNCVHLIEDGKHESVQIEVVEYEKLYEMTE